MTPTNTRWREEAKCLGQSPSEFDTAPGTWPKEINKENSDMIREALIRASEVCDGCPVMKECARDIKYQDVGVIRAGLALPEAQYRAGAHRNGLGTAIELVASGVDPSVSIDEVIARD